MERWARKRDALMAGTIKMSTQSVPMADPQKFTIKALLYTRGTKAKEIGTGGGAPVKTAPKYNIIITDLVVPKDKGPMVKVKDVGEFPVYERLGPDRVAIRVCLNREQVGTTGKKYEDAPRALVEPYVLTRGMKLQISVNKDGKPKGFDTAPGSLVPVTIYNCFAKYWIKAAPAAAAATAPTSTAAAGSAPADAAAAPANPNQPYVFMSADAFSLDPVTRPLEELIRMLLPYECNLLPETFDPPAGAKVYGDDRPIRLPGKVFRLSMNRDVRGEAVDAEAAAFVLPDEQVALEGKVRAGTRTMITKYVIDEYVRDKRPTGLSTSIFAYIEQHSDLAATAAAAAKAAAERAAAAAAGEDDTEIKMAKTWVDIALLDIRPFTDAHLQLGITCWTLALAVLRQQQGQLPPLPTTVLIQPDLEQGTSHDNAPATKQGSYDLAFREPQASMVVPHLAEFAYRYGLRVKPETINARYNLAAPQTAFAGLFTPDQRVAPFESNKWDPPIEWIRYEYTFERHCGYVPLDGSKSAVPAQPEEFNQIAAKFNFYALPVMQLAQLGLEYPIEEVGGDDAGIKTFRRKAEYDTVAKGDEFVRDSLRRATQGIAKLKALASTDDLIKQADAWLMPTNGVEGQTTHLPRWTFIALPRDYVPADPATFPQPSAATATAALAEKPAAPTSTTKRPRDDDKTADAAVRSPIKKRRTDAGAVASGGDSGSSDGEAAGKHDPMELDQESSS
jgi:hypothetical protein